MLVNKNAKSAAEPRPVAQLVGASIHRTVVGSTPHQGTYQVAGLMPGWGVYRRQMIDVSLSQWSLCLSLSPQMYPSVRVKKQSAAEKQGPYQALPADKWGMLEPSHHEKAKGGVSARLNFTQKLRHAEEKSS